MSRFLSAFAWTLALAIGIAASAVIVVLGRSAASGDLGGSGWFALTASIALMISLIALVSRPGDTSEMEIISEAGSVSSSAEIASHQQDRAEQFCRSLKDHGIELRVDPGSLDTLSGYLRSIAGDLRQSKNLIQGAAALFGEVMVQEIGGSWSARKTPGGHVRVVVLGYGPTRHELVPALCVLWDAERTGATLDKLLENEVQEQLAVRAETPP